MNTTRWLTIAVCGVMVVQTVVLWAHAKKTGKNVWRTIRLSVILGALVAISLVPASRFEDPDRMDWTILIAMAMLLPLAIWMGLDYVKAYLQDVGLVAKKKK